MALMTNDEPPRLVRGLLGFNMYDDEGRAVLVRIPLLAIQKAQQQTDDKDAVVRRRFEKIARFKYAGGRTEPDGSILISIDDLDLA